MQILSVKKSKYLFIQAGLKVICATKELVSKYENQAVNLTVLDNNSEKYFLIPLFPATEVDCDNLLALNIKRTLLFITSLSTKNKIQD